MTQFHPVNSIVNPDIKQDDRVLKIRKFLLYILGFALIVGFIISTSIKAREVLTLKEELIMKDETIVNERIIHRETKENNSKLLDENKQLKKAMCKRLRIND